MSHTTNLFDTLKEVLPEVTWRDDGKYNYNGYEICIPCHYIKTKEGKLLGRFVNKDSFVKLLERIK
jgi:hypothetical protein